MNSYMGYFVLKRLLDIVLSAFAIVLSFPIWLIAIVGIIVSDPGPVFYKACRVGLNNKEFYMWKFRSMRVPRSDSEKKEGNFKADSSRIFPFGEIMRRTKIDELPQLINVFCGSMSIVGPRPASKDQVGIMRAGKYNVASKVKPGLTGPAALYDYLYGDNIDNEADYERLVLPTRLELEAYYPGHMSLIFDGKIIAFTAICIIATVFGIRCDGIMQKLTKYAEEERKTHTYGVNK